MRNSESELQSLSMRLDKLESQNRKWRLATMVLAVSSASLVLIAAKPADNIDPKVIHARTVEAQDFVIKDAGGQIRARLTLNPQVKIKPSPYDSEIVVNVPLGPALQFYNDKGDAIWTEPRAAEVIPAR